MHTEIRPGSLSGLADDQLATAAVSLVAAELQWTPDVSPAVMDRISRDAVAYPEQFDRRLAPAAPPAPRAQNSRSAKRTAGRLVVFAVMLAIIVALVLFAATANASATDLDPLELGSVDVARDYAGPSAVTHAVSGSSTHHLGEVAGLVARSAAHVPIGAIDGRLVSFGADEDGKLHAAEQGGRVFHVVTEAS